MSKFLAACMNFGHGQAVVMPVAVLVPVAVAGGGGRLEIRGDRVRPMDTSEPKSAPDRDSELSSSSSESPSPESLAVAVTRKRLIWTAVLAGACLLIGLVLGAWWYRSPPVPSFHAPSPPPGVATPAQEDPEQQALTAKPAEPVLDERLEEVAIELSRDDLTDYEAVELLGGSWKLDLRPRGRKRVLVVLDTAQPQTLSGESFDLTVYRAESKDLAPFYTVMRQQGGRPTLIFLQADGEYQMELEDLAFEGADFISYRVDGSRRRFGQRRRGSRWRFDADPQRSKPPRVEQPAAQGEGEQDFEIDRSAEESAAGTAPQKITVHRARSDPKAAWRRARELRQQGKLDTLETLLGRMLLADASDRQARNWLRDVGTWRRKQHDKLRRTLDGKVQALSRAVDRHDRQRIFAVWDGSPPAEIRQIFERQLERSNELAARLSVTSFEVRDGTAEFIVSVTLQGKGQGRRQSTIENFAWQGRLRGDRWVP